MKFFLLTHVAQCKLHSNSCDLSVLIFKFKGVSFMSQATHLFTDVVVIEGSVISRGEAE